MSDTDLDHVHSSLELGSGEVDNNDTSNKDAVLAAAGMMIAAVVAFADGDPQDSSNDFTLVDFTALCDINPLNSEDSWDVGTTDGGGGGGGGGRWSDFTGASESSTVGGDGGGTMQWLPSRHTTCNPRVG